MVQISEVKGNSRENRTAAHTHIRGLGLNPQGVAEKQAAGFVGQTAAREVCPTRCEPYVMERELTIYNHCRPAAS